MRRTCCVTYVSHSATLPHTGNLYPSYTGAAWVVCTNDMQNTLLRRLCRYLYKDTIDMDMEPAAAAAVLQVGLYYGAARLIGLCEVVLSRTLTDPNVSLQGSAPRLRGYRLPLSEICQQDRVSSSSKPCSPDARHARRHTVEVSCPP